MKRFIALLVAAAVLCYLISACSSSQQGKEAVRYTEPPIAEETVKEYHTNMKWSIVGTHYDYYPSEVKDVERAVTWKIYLDEYKSTVDEYDIRDLYMELLQTQDPDNNYISHTALIYFDQKASLSESGYPDISIVPITQSYDRHDAEATGYLGRFIITHNGVCSPAVKN